MQSFKATFINEIEKMYHKKKVIVAALLSLLVIIVGQILVSGVRMQLGLRTVGGSEFPILVLSVLINTVLPLFTALLAIDLFAGEFSHNTMKLTLLRPVSRFKIFLSKIAAIAAFLLTTLLMVLILSTISGAIFNSSGFSAVLMAKVALSYILTLFPFIAFALVVIFLANIFKSGSAVLFLSIILFALFKVLELLFPAYSSILITSTFSWYKLWIMETVSILKILRQFLIMAGYGIMFFTAGFYLFEKRDI